MEGVFNVGDRVKIIKSRDAKNIGKTCVISRMCESKCLITDINDKSHWVTYDSIVHYDDGSVLKYIELKERIEIKRKICEDSILSAVNRFMADTGLRVTDVIYDYDDALDGNVRDQTVRIEAKTV